MESLWVQRESASELSVEGFDGVVTQFLASRGFKDSQSVHEFLFYNLKNLKDPLSLLGMDKALQRLTIAKQNQEAICVYGDFDMDGTPALALMHRGLRGLGFKNIFYCQPDRHADGYGFHFHLAQKYIQENNVKVFITVDVGITDVENIKQVQSLGVDVILTDHHQVLDEIPPAYCIVNPNQPGCTSGLGFLCGTGVGFYLIMALRRHLKEQNLLESEFDIKSLLDCFAIGTVADLVPMVKENRILVKHGLKVLEKTSMVGIRLLLEALKMNDKMLRAQDVAIRFVPKLNSLTRLDLDLKPIDVFMVEDPAKAALMVQTVLKNNEHRVALLDEAEALLEAMIVQKSIQDSQSDVLFFWSEHFHKGLVGLLATQLVNRFQRPAFVGALTKKGVIVGSARAPNGSSVSVLKTLQDASLCLNKFGGHPAAAGFELSPERAKEFEATLIQVLRQNVDLALSQKYDLKIDFHGIQSFMKSWDSLEPFGQQFETPVFRVDGLKAQKVTTMKNTHLKTSFVDAKGFLMECVWFFPPDLDFFKASEGKLYSILCEPQWNEFMGSRRIQLLLKEIKETV
jgi:single-stranded-DNA-specific exonuclease